MNSSSFWAELFSWLDRNFSKLLLAFGIGHRIGASGKEKVKKELELEKYEKEKLQNEIEVEKSSASRDVVADFIKRNRE